LSGLGEPIGSTISLSSESLTDWLFNNNSSFKTPGSTASYKRLIIAEANIFEVIPQKNYSSV
jgi:hypothetical protein